MARVGLRQGFQNGSQKLIGAKNFINIQPKETHLVLLTNNEFVSNLINAMMKMESPNQLQNTAK